MTARDIPVFKTKVEGVTERFDLTDRADRRTYFDRKLGPELEAIRAYLKQGTFIAYLLGKKNSGKGTYSKLFMEAVGAGNIGHVAMGDIIRDVHAALADPVERGKLISFLRENYRGFHSVEETIDLIEGRSQTNLLSSELALALLKYEISKRPRQALFIDGFPRALDQVGYAMFLKELLGFRDDPDFFVFSSVPNNVIDERIKYRVICPLCKTPRNLKLLATKEAGYDEATSQYYLKCDNPDCAGTRMVAKEGDDLGIEPIRDRLKVDDEIFERLLNLQGVPKVLLRNAIPVDAAAENVDDYEITPAYDYERQEDGSVKIVEKPYVVDDDQGVPSYSLLPAAVVIGLIKQVADLLKR